MPTRSLAGHVHDEHLLEGVGYDRVLNCEALLLALDRPDTRGKWLSVFRFRATWQQARNITDDAFEATNFEDHDGSTENYFGLLTHGSGHLAAEFYLVLQSAKPIFLLRTVTFTGVLPDSFCLLHCTPSPKISTLYFRVHRRRPCANHNLCSSGYRHKTLVQPPDATYVFCARRSTALRFQANLLAAINVAYRDQ